MVVEGSIDLLPMKTVLKSYLTSEFVKERKKEVQNDPLLHDAS